MHFVSNTCLFASGLLVSTCLAAPTDPSKPDCLPIIDLGYELHQALFYNATTDVYKFSNIRYAKAPTGELRFRAPVPPEQDRDVIQNGSEPRVCPQGFPDWQARAFRPIGMYSAGKPFSLAAWEADIANSPVPNGTYNADTTEDCLFLDVHVPRKVLLKAAKDPKGLAGAPVLAWIHGGGYVLSSKLGHPNPSFDPSGLIQHAGQVDDTSMIFVAINYRLGALGFLAGKAVREDGNLNAGLLDQRLALDWIQKYIHLFGGSAKRVTAMGESAGGVSVLLHMTAFGGLAGSAPFTQAIPQSPAVISAATEANSEPAMAEFLRYLNVSSLSEARKLPEKNIIDANAAQIKASGPTSYIFGPVEDGEMVPAKLGRVLAAGQFDKTVKVMAAHNSFEGGFFFDPDVKTEEQFQAWLEWSLAGLSPADVEYLMNTLYPPQFDGSLGYVDQGSRQMAVWGEAVIDCNFDQIGRVVNGSYAYEFGVTPGLHTQDLKYTFNDPMSSVPFPSAQDTLQQAIASFVVNGVPVVKGIEVFPQWGSERALVNVTASGPQYAKSLVNETRCAWWQEGRYS